MLAVQLDGQLPEDLEDAFIVLTLLRELFENYLDKPSPMPNTMLADQISPDIAGDPKNVLRF